MPSGSPFRRPQQWHSETTCWRRSSRPTHNVLLFIDAREKLEREQIEYSQNSVVLSLPRDSGTLAPARGVWQRPRNRNRNRNRHFCRAGQHTHRAKPQREEAPRHGSSTMTMDSAELLLGDARLGSRSLLEGRARAVQARRCSVVGAAGGRGWRGGGMGPGGEEGGVEWD